MIRATIMLRIAGADLVGAAAKAPADNPFDRI
jgi:hypothetical protein